MKKIKVVLLLCFLSSSYGLAQQSDPISGVIDATGSAVKELQDELAKRPAETHFVAGDYKRWNLSFREQLDKATTTYAGRIATEIKPVLTPLVDRYKAIMSDTTIRDDQRALLASPVCDQLRELGTSLDATYQAIYMELLKNTFGWLPYVEYTVSSHTNPLAIVAIAGVITAGFAADNFTNHYIKYRLYRLDRRGGVIASGKYKTYGSSILNDVNLVNTPKNSQSSFYRDRFFYPEIHDSCKSQVCLGLLAADLELALSRFREKLDVPFTTKDGCVNIKNLGFDVSYFENILRVPFSDVKILFDIPEEGSK